jgi:hypothetical protein
MLCKQSKSWGSETDKAKRLTESCVVWLISVCAFRLVRPHAQIPIVDIPGVTWPCGTGGCQVRDVWTQSNTQVTDGSLVVSLAVHESAYYIVG